MDIDGKNQRNLTKHPHIDRSPQFSPDGSKLIFLSLRDENYEIYSMDLSGNNQINLSNNPSSDEEPIFSPDGESIVFTRYHEGNYEIFRMDLNGNNQENLTNNSANDIVPNVSPFNDKIVFSSDRDGLRQIYSMNLDGSMQENLSNNSYNERNPKYTPDGSNIVYLSFRNTSFAIYTMKPDGSAKRELQKNPRITSFANHNFSFSHDSKIMIFDFLGSVAIPGSITRTDIYIKTIENETAPQNLTKSDLVYDSDPKFFADGANIVFVSENSTGTSQIFKMQSNGNQLKNLTNSNSPCGSPVIQPLEK